MALRLGLADAPILDALELAPMLESEFGRGETGAHGWPAALRLHAECRDLVTQPPPDKMAHSAAARPEHNGRCVHTCIVVDTKWTPRWKCERPPRCGLLITPGFLLANVECGEAI
jgi:hypothetical protein